MADYRSWCYSCGEEIGFGGHAKNCAALKEQRDAEREQRDAERTLVRHFENMSDDELLKVALDTRRKKDALEQALRAVDSRYYFLYRQIYWRDFKLMNRLREEEKKLWNS